MPILPPSSRQPRGCYADADNDMNWARSQDRTGRGHRQQRQGGAPRRSHHLRDGLLLPTPMAAEMMQTGSADERTA
jgi:hypothetical protein